MRMRDEKFNLLTSFFAIEFLKMLFIFNALSAGLFIDKAIVCLFHFFFISIMHSAS